MSIQPLFEPVEDDMRAVDALIRQRLNSDVVLINTLGEYIIASGGKRLRPALVLLAARASGYTGDQHHLLATIIEFIHTATLLHDDVVDESTLRRGRDTANTLWGNDASVLTGDFLYSRAFQMMVELDSFQIMRVLADATNRIAEGEVMQLMHSHDPDLAEKDYLEVVDRKTASLFAAGCRLAAELAGCDAARCDAMATYGRHLGVAFQVIDDSLDYGRGDGDYGKNVGDDLAEGKATLPLIRALSQVETAVGEPIRRALRDGDRDALDDVLKAIESTDAMEYTCRRAEGEADKAVAALDVFDESPFKATLVSLAEFSVQRRY
ncbi:polyprenyl synthetase family protein [Salinisphaera orenii]|uniref:Octaprenyl diphosphate synthase n=1 Tax=Salinisphaera orenii YIM 95161 TaxID=1051139 RepID=A0A423PDG3_9GAMM|nr:polyprenyl synthetase family protein [Salinisphaera halophila]ROO22399.1 octaprenyl-diphosphate synthase [Salinisphaera halophila YIM 95161]